METVENNEEFGRVAEDAILDDVDEDEQGGPTRTRDLRKEADEMRQCFTRYAFQAIGLCSLAFAGLFQLMFRQPAVGLFAFGLLPIILAICRLGTYKYAISNRAYGYEFYLERTRDVPAEFRGRWKPEYRGLSWEEAMHAWRVVQAILFEKICVKGHVWPDRIRSAWKIRKRRSVWFLPATEFEKSSNAKWFPSTYLRNLMVFLYIMALCAVAIMLLSAGEFMLIRKPPHAPEPAAQTEQAAVAGPKARQSSVVNGLVQHLAMGGARAQQSEAGVAQRPPAQGDFSAPLLLEPFDGLPGPAGAWASGVAALFSFLLISLRWWSDSVRCRMLRSELQSIPANALIWQATVIAHYTAVGKSRQYRLTTDQLLDIVSELRGKELKSAKSGNAEFYIAREQQKKSFDFQPDGLGLMGYSFWLSQEAASLAANALDIHGWIATRCKASP
ncbi:MAG: hypothetical protein P4L57_01855 [Rhizomicrobium sp.]|nr:hypothetical protein [Rhizomicrobium sp.]